MNVDKHENWQVYKQPAFGIIPQRCSILKPFGTDKLQYLSNHFTKKEWIRWIIFSPALEIRV